MASPWAVAGTASLRPMSVGYFKGRTRVTVLLTILSLLKDHIRGPLHEVPSLHFRIQQVVETSSISEISKYMFCFFRFVCCLQVHPKLAQTIQQLVARRVQMPSKKEELLGNFKLSVRGSIRKAPNVVPGPK